MTSMMLLLFTVVLTSTVAPVSSESWTKYKPHIKEMDPKCKLAPYYSTLTPTMCNFALEDDASFNEEDGRVCNSFCDRYVKSFKRGERLSKECPNGDVFRPGYCKQNVNSHCHFCQTWFMYNVCCHSCIYHCPEYRPPSD